LYELAKAAQPAVIASSCREIGSRETELGEKRLDDRWHCPRFPPD
jgi:hypothetical protein